MCARLCVLAGEGEGEQSLFCKLQMPFRCLKCMKLVFEKIIRYVLW